MTSGDLYHVIVSTSEGQAFDEDTTAQDAPEAVRWACSVIQPSLATEERITHLTVRRVND